MSLLPEFVAAMYAEYEAGASLSALGRKYGRDCRSIQEVFARRGFALRPGTNPNAIRLANGQIAPARLFTKAEIDEMIATAKKVAIPARLKHEWRKWSLERRGEFIARLRKKINAPTDRPETPFSVNVIPFDYATPLAQEIMAEMNAGLGSRDARIKMDICSQGVIWDGRFWFWSHKVGYQSGPWTPEGSRPCLHRVIWEMHNGRRVPAKHVVIFLDGNYNNFDAGNLVLRTMDDNCRRNQAASLTAKSRQLTKILLKKTQRKERNGLIDITDIRR